MQGIHAKSISHSHKKKTWVDATLHFQCKGLFHLCCVRLSRFLNALKIIALSFHSLSSITGRWVGDIAHHNLSATVYLEYSPGVSPALWAVARMSWAAPYGPSLMADDDVGRQYRSSFWRHFIGRHCWPKMSSAALKIAIKPSKTRFKLICCIKTTLKECNYSIHEYTITITSILCILIAEPNIKYNVKDS